MKMTYPEPTPETKPQWALLFCTVFAFFAGGALGWAYFTSPACEPTPAPPPPYVVHERPVTSLEMVVGLADLVADLHTEAKATRSELYRTKQEARRIIQAMVQEINRLRATPRPTPTKSANDAPTNRLGPSPSPSPSSRNSPPVVFSGR